MSEDLMATKQEELTKLVIAWARENNLVEYDDQVSVKIEIKKPKSVFSTELTDEDWKIILADEWDDESRAVLERLRDNKNVPIPDSADYRIDQYIQSRLRTIPPYLLSIGRNPNRGQGESFKLICVKKRVREIRKPRHRRG